jgi:hypothetical protein
MGFHCNMQKHEHVTSFNTLMTGRHFPACVHCAWTISSKLKWFSCLASFENCSLFLHICYLERKLACKTSWQTLSRYVKQELCSTSCWKIVSCTHMQAFCFLCVNVVKCILFQERNVFTFFIKCVYLFKSFK